MKKKAWANLKKTWANLNQNLPTFYPRIARVFSEVKYLEKDTGF